MGKNRRRQIQGGLFKMSMGNDIHLWWVIQRYLWINHESFINICGLFMANSWSSMERSYSCSITLCGDRWESSGWLGRAPKLIKGYFCADLRWVFERFFEICFGRSSIHPRFQESSGIICKYSGGAKCHAGGREMSLCPKKVVGGRGGNRNAQGVSYFRLINVRWYPSFHYYRLINVGWFPSLKIKK